MKLSTFLRKSREKIDTPDKWIQGDMCANAKGHVVRYDDPTACKFCLVGAMLMTRKEIENIPLRAYKIDGEAWYFPLHREARSVVEEQVQGRHLTSFNDMSTHAEVIEALNKAIREVEIRETLGDI